MHRNLSSLEAEQRVFQLSSQKVGGSGNRFLGEYSFIFGMPYHWFEDKLQELILEKELTTFLDLGCNNGATLRHAMKLASELGRAENLRAIGVDALPLADTISHTPLPAELKMYEPEFRKDDIETFRFPANVDFVTICATLMWTRDPVAIIANAASQLSVSKYLGVNNLTRINIEDGQTSETLLELIARKKGKLSGFEALNREPGDSGGHFLVKVEPLSDHEEILARWFGSIPILDRRTHNQRINGFDYYYKVSN